MEKACQAKNDVKINPQRESKDVKHSSLTTAKTYLKIIIFLRAQNEWNLEQKNSTVCQKVGTSAKS